MTPTALQPFTAQTITGTILDHRKPVAPDTIYVQVSVRSNSSDASCDTYKSETDVNGTFVMHNVAVYNNGQYDVVVVGFNNGTMLTLNKTYRFGEIPVIDIAQA